MGDQLVCRVQVTHRAGLVVMLQSVFVQRVVPDHRPAALSMAENGLVLRSMRSSWNLQLCRLVAASVQQLVWQLPNDNLEPCMDYT
jgi:hypothetical protein